MLEDAAPPEEIRVSDSAGHVSVHVEGAHPVDIPFLFERQPKRLGLSFLASFAIDALIAFALVVASRTHFLSAGTQQPVVETPPTNQIIWIAQEGPGGGGGGGGNKMKEPPRQAQLPGKDRITVPVAETPTTQQAKAKSEPNPAEELMIPAKTLASGTESLPGAIDAPPGPPTLSQGSGSGGGAGTGTGSGIGSGTGSGLGPGSGGGTGGGVYRPGSGVTSPIEIERGKPQYTAEAMRARIQGSVTVECVVQPSGVCSDIRVVRSLDPTFGLDEEAVKSVRKWRFKPGMRMGQPVPVLVTIEVAFTLR